MKRKYEKPLFGVEIFSLTQSVARDCGSSIPEDQLTFGDPNECFWDLGGDTRVFVLPPNCNLDGENMGVGCYNNPSEGNYVFRS